MFLKTPDSVIHHLEELGAGLRLWLVELPLQNKKDAVLSSALCFGSPSLSRLESNVFHLSLALRTPDREIKPE